MEPDRSPDLARTVLRLLALAALVASSFLIVRPFLAAVTWATMLAVATWPLLVHVQAWLGGRRSLAVAAMTIVLLLVLVVPVYLGVRTIVENTREIVEGSRTLATLSVPPPPAWVAGVPLVGAKLASRWQQVAAASPDEVAARLVPLAKTLVLWFAGQVGSVGLLLVQFLLTVVVVAILYANGETVARGMDRFARRLAGAEGAEAVQLAARAIRAVALGVVVTAIVQAALVAVGFAVAGVPFAAILTALVFILAVAQIGAAPVLIPAVVWVYVRTGTLWGTIFLVWAVFCTLIDNVLRPALIKRGAADLPLLLIFAGVIGGLVAFGVIGLFIGPVVLAVGWTLLAHWVKAGEVDAAQNG